MDPVTAARVVSVLAVPLLRDILESVAKKNFAIFKDIASGLKSKDEAVSKEDAAQLLERLKAENLIKEQPSRYQDLKTYYVTAQGLAVERELRRMGKMGKDLPQQERAESR